MKFSDADLSETLECFGENHSDMVVLGKKLGTHAVREICGLMGGRKVHVPEFDNLVWDLKRAVRDEDAADHGAEQGEAGVNPGRHRRG